MLWYNARYKKYVYLSVIVLIVNLYKKVKL